jgi:hypothetical protein
LRDPLCEQDQQCKRDSPEGNVEFPARTKEFPCLRGCHAPESVQQRTDEIRIDGYLQKQHVNVPQWPNEMRKVANKQPNENTHRPSDSHRPDRKLRRAGTHAVGWLDHRT